MLACNDMGRGFNDIAMKFERATSTRKQQLNIIVEETKLLRLVEEQHCYIIENAT
jgi:hypothetical protein